MTKINKYRLLRLAKAFFKKNPRGAITMEHTMLLTTGEIGSTTPNYKLFKYALNNVLANNAKFHSITFDYRRNQL